MRRAALVTGATGGLGRTFVPMLLAQGWTVRATGRDARAAPADAAFVAADLCDADPAPLVRGIDTLFHLAARSAPFGPAAAFEAINVSATIRLLTAARAAGVRRFVHVSTPSIYAEPRDRLAITEDDPPARAFANAYARTKYAGERAVLGADSQAMRTIVLRPRAIVGRHDRVLLPRLMRVARRGWLPLPRGGAALIELTDARDVGAALIAAADATAGGLAINISGGEPRSVRAVVERLGLPIRIVPIPIGIALAGATLAEAIGRRRDREPAITRYSMMTLAYSQTFDLSRARETLGWVPRITPEAAIAAAIDA